jgi:hypothetical protein
MPAKQRAHRKSDNLQAVLAAGQIIFVPRFHIESGRTVLSRAEIVRVRRKWLIVRFENGQRGKLLKGK